MIAGLYGHCMLIDGNDPRGIDVGILTKPECSTTAKSCRSSPRSALRYLTW